MRRIPALLPCGLLALLAPVHAGDFIRQIQTVNNATVIYQIDITGDAGQVTSQPLNGPNAIFQLYATVTANNTSTLTKLDEKTVGTYTPLPSAATVISSEDPYVPARTRADRLYGLQVLIGGLSSEPGASDMMKKVQMVRSYNLYDSTSYGPTANKGSYANPATFAANGTYNSTGIIQVLPVIAPVTANKAVGTETFTVYTWPTTGVTQSQLSSATIQIWPVADAVITGIEDGKTYKDVPKTATVTLKDLYPRSTTYAQVYKGAPTLGAKATVLPSTPVAFNTFSPQNAMLTLADLGDSMKDSTGTIADGLYTLEIATITPFNNGTPERLTYLSFTVSRTLKVNSALGTSSSGQ